MSRAGESRVHYEKFLATSPHLLWALARQWSSREASNRGCALWADESTAWLVREGRARVRHDGVTIEAGPGEWLFPKPGQRVQEFFGPLDFLSLSIRWKWPDGRHLYDDGLSRVVKAGEAPWIEKQAMPMVKRVRAIAPDIQYYLGHAPVTASLAAELAELGGRWARAYARAMKMLGIEEKLDIGIDLRVKGLIQALDKYPLDSTPDREALAGAYGVSTRQLDRLMMAATGQTVVGYYDTRRQELVRRTMLLPGVQIKRVARLAGFPDAATFSRWFHRKFKVSPRTFRKQFVSV